MTDVNNKSYSLEGGIRIPEGADLYSDTYKVPGNYYCPTHSVGVTLKNCPYEGAFTMKVSYGNGVGYPQQTINGINGEKFFRYFNVDENVWRDTFKFITNSNIDPNTMWQFTNKNAVSIPENDDMSTEKYRVSGVYVCESNTKAATLSNCPANGEAFILFVYKSLSHDARYITQEFRTLYNNVHKRFWNYYDNAWKNEVKYITNADLGGAVFQRASGTIKHGMNGIYIGKFDNGPTNDSGSALDFCIYLICTGSDQTVAYAFTVLQYNGGHLFFNRMSINNIWQISPWKKLLA